MNTMSTVEKGEYKRLSINEEEGVGHHDPVKPPKTAVSRSAGWRRCVVYTLLVLVGIVLLFMIGSYLFVRHQVQRFTIPAGADGIPTFPSQPVPNAQLQVAIDEANLFWDTLQAGQTPDHDFVITQDILNGFIAQDDYANTHAAVTIQDHSIRLDLSLPVDGLPGGSNRYFVSAATIETEPDESSGTTVTAALTPPYSVPKIHFPTLLQATLVASRNDNKGSLQMTYGQLFNAVVPQEWLDQHQDLLSCDWDCHHHAHDGDHHHHDGHHGRKLHGHGHHHHQRDHWQHDHHHMECEEIMAMVKRLSVSIVDGQIIVHASESNNKGGRRLQDKVALELDSLFSKRRWVRRALRAAF